MYSFPVKSEDKNGIYYLEHTVFMEWPHAYLNLLFYPEDLQFQLSS